MWTAVALTTLLTLPPGQGLELKNVRTTYGVMGETRKEDKVLPGDVVAVSFDIDGLKVKDDGLVQYAMGVELVKTGKAKPEFKRDLQDLEGENSLGGTTLPAYAFTLIGIDSPPGEYTLKVTIKDRLAKADKPTVLSKKFEVLPAKLGFVQVHLTDGNGAPVPPLAVCGQRLFVNYSLVGFKLNKEKKADLTIEMAIKDASDRPTVAKPFKGPIITDPKGGVLAFRPRALELNRPGKYTVVITAKDNVSDTTTTQELHLNVLPAPN